MGKRNAHAVAARQRKAGAHKDIPQMTCDECGCNMGYKPPSMLCAPCTLGIRPDPKAVEKQIVTTCSRRAGKTKQNLRCILQAHTHWSDEKITRVLAEAFDEG